jgi:hypothetical protein
VDVVFIECLLFLPPMLVRLGAWQSVQPAPEATRAEPGRLDRGVGERLEEPLEEIAEPGPSAAPDWLRGGHIRRRRLGGFWVGGKLQTANFRCGPFAGTWWSFHCGPSLRRGVSGAPLLYRYFRRRDICSPCAEPTHFPHGLWLDTIAFRVVSG